MRRLERWLFSAGSAERLATLRIGLCLLLAARLSRGVYVDLAGQPPALFRPLSFMNLLDGMPPRPIVAAAQVIGVVAAMLGAAGLKSRVTLPLAWGCGMLLNGMVTSSGKVMHNDVMLMLALVPLLAAPVSDAWSIDALRRRRPPGSGLRYGWPVRTAAVVVVGGYFFAGLNKLLSSGPAWVTSDNLRWVMYGSSDAQAVPNQLALFVADRAWLAHVLAAVTMTLELAAPLALRRRAAPLFVLAVAGMHAGIWLAMRLDYWAWVATAAVVLIDWPHLFGRLRLVRPPAEVPALGHG